MVVCCFVCSFLIVQAQQQSRFKPTDWVNPFIGTAEHGHVFLGANMPSGFVQVGPSNIVQTWDSFNGCNWFSAI